MRHFLAASLATLLVMASSEQQPPWEHDDGSQERQRPRPRPMGRKASPSVRDMRPAVQRWARPANVANGALLLVSGLPVAMRGGLLNLQPIGLLLGGWVRLPTSNHALRPPLPCAQPGAPRLTRSTAPNPEPPPTAQVSLFGMLLLLVEVRLKPVRDWLRRNFGFFFTSSGRKGMLTVLAWRRPSSAAWDARLRDGAAPRTPEERRSRQTPQWQLMVRP